jgi:hypothetical protein
MTRKRAPGEAVVVGADIEPLGMRAGSGEPAKADAGATATTGSHGLVQDGGIGGAFGLAPIARGEDSQTQRNPNEQ